MFENNAGTAPQNIPETEPAARTGENTRLTSSELANLWANYMSSSLKGCMVSYFLEKTEDGQIREVLKYAQHVAKQHLAALSAIYRRENHPIPRGLTDEDVNVNAPRLFTDGFILYYLEFTAETRINGYSTALPMSSRADIREYFTECMASNAELYNRTAGVLLSRGQYLRSPQIPTPERVDFVKKQGFMTGFLGERRPLTAIEISHIYARAKTNLLRKALFTGFAQVARSRQVRDYMIRGKDIANKQIEILSSMLAKNGLPMQAPWDSGVLQSSVSPFSERLMAQNVRAFNAVEITNIGKALSVGLRHDLTAIFARFLAELGKYTEDGVNLLIDNGWLEEPPQADDPESLKKKMH